MILKCKICGGTLSFEQGDKIAVCDYCGREQTLPSGNVDEKIAILYERANSYRLVNEFDKAANIYNQIIAENPKDGEAYWNLALCNYGVVYVQDPKSLEYIPTCNRTQYLSLLHDGNYKNALKYATEEQCAIYEKDACYINEVQKSIINIAKREKPFDIFICYKETTVEGKRTRDSIKAQELYEALTAQGYKVFFSRITLESKIGAEYEPYIYAALASSKVMIHITSSGENSDAVWVKNEWSRYLALALKDGNKTFIPIYFDMDKTELPNEFENIASYDMQKEGFQQELIRGIKKLIPTPIMKLQRRKKRRKVLGITGLILAVCVAIGVVVSIPKIEEYNALKEEYDAAMQLYYDKEYPQAAWAFADLGTFKDSEEMKNSAEKSWRLSFANVAMINWDGAIWDENGAYYINANGTISTFDFKPGSAHKGIEINEHGKIVSLGGNAVWGDGENNKNRNFWALYEDGHVANVNYSTLSETEWADVVQISQGFNCTNIALRADGTMIYGNLEQVMNGEDYSYSISDGWLAKISEWTDIVAFDCWAERLEGGGIYAAGVVAVKADGTLCATFGGENFDGQDGYYELESESYIQEAKDFIEKVDNAKAVSVNTFNGRVCIVVLTESGQIETYIDGEENQYEAAEVVSIISTSEIDLNYDTNLNVYILKDTGELMLLEDTKSILSDVVYVNDRFAVTRSGSIYRYNYGYDHDVSTLDTIEPIKTEGKTRVYDEWLERLK